MGSEMCIRDSGQCMCHSLGCYIEGLHVSTSTPLSTHRSEILFAAGTYPAADSNSTLQRISLHQRNFVKGLLFGASGRGSAPSTGGGDRASRMGVGISSGGEDRPSGMGSVPSWRGGRTPRSFILGGMLSAKRITLFWLVPLFWRGDSFSTTGPRRHGKKKGLKIFGG